MRRSSRPRRWATRSGLSAATALVNEVLNGIRPGVPLGIVAAGHSNVLARALGGRSRRISVGRVNGRRFAFAAGIGVDSDVVREMETVKRAQQGTTAG